MRSALFAATLLLVLFIDLSCTDLPRQVVDRQGMSLSAGDIRQINAAVHSLFVQQRWPLQPVFRIGSQQKQGPSILR
jgi:hypothetical protein